MNFEQLAGERFSCRKFSEEKVPQELMEKIIEISMLAPTAVNKQPYKIFWLTSAQAKASVEQVTRFTFGAKDFLVVGCKEDEAWVRKYDGKNFADVDGSIVATHMMLAITELGLASTWVGCFDAPKLKELCPQMEGYNLLAIFPIGYAGEEPCERHFQRKAKEEVLEII